MIRNLLFRFATHRREPLFTTEQLTGTFMAGFRAGQEAGAAQPLVHRPLAEIVAEFTADRAVVIPMAGRS